MSDKKITGWKKLGSLLLDIVCPFWTLFDAMNIYRKSANFGKEAALVPGWAGGASFLAFILFGSLILLGSLSLLGPLAPLMSLSLPLLAICGYACMYVAKFVGSLIGHAHLFSSYPQAKKVIPWEKVAANSLGYTFLGTSFKYVREEFNSKRKESIIIHPDEQIVPSPHIKRNRNRSPVVAWSAERTAESKNVLLDSPSRPKPRTQPSSSWTPVMLPGIIPKKIRAQELSENSSPEETSSPSISQ